ncbi:hypothetical protein Poli38472_004494 [Pythium oligandrum]|uniref:Intraflagellar transport protein 46 homolog n=1 Tax=Pythium oligandrum TaxID=41045 RepID=A0A8K1CAC9_PYTOL|nr:hypothetical protein Poli38472_004494 [Pythium oligandrum]|eukprot:TMW59425.1 hypothetical protein Poli38472_004494 [Pythium oligandrum]
MASKRDAKRDAEEEEEDEEDDDEEISGSEEEEDDDDEDSGSEDEMSESGDARGADAKGASKAGGKTAEKGSERSLQNQPFDEAVDLSESEDSVADPGRESPKKTTKTLKNLPFDEALELSASAQDLESPVKKPAPASRAQENDKGKAAAPSGAKDTAAPGAELKNRPFDEEVDLSDSGDSVDTNEPSSPPKVKQNTPAPAAKVKETIAPMPKKDDKPPPKQVEERVPPQASAKPTPTSASAAASSASKAPEKKAPEPKRKEVSESSSEGSESEEDDDEDDGEEEEEEEEAPPPRGKSGGAAAAGGSSSAAGAPGAGANASATHATMLANAGEYKESEYAHLKVSNDIKELFQYIGRFKPQEIELETRLKCFIPEYIPAVGDMDAFLKIPRPDNEADHLGLKMLDEPSLNQSDATVLDLQLRSTSKKKHGDIVVRSIENAEKSPKEIDRWIKSIADLHRTKPPPQVHYTKPMPDIESLMQVWPEEFEELLSKTTLPSASMDMSVEQYLRVICAILDIPVYKNVYESVHVLFTLYLEFRSNQHFMNYDDNAPVMMNGNANGGQSSPPPFTSRRDDSQDEYVSSSRK